MASVEYDAATRLYPGTPKPAVNELNLAIPDGELICSANAQQMLVPRRDT